MRVLVLASTFPRWADDTIPPFVYDLSQHLARRGHEMHVLAPHVSGATDDERMDDLIVHRFHYAPAAYESLAYGGGVLENLKADRKRWALVPAFMGAELAASLRAVRRNKIDLVHAHWLVPQGLVAAASRRFLKMPIVMTAHGGDVFAMTRGTRRRLLSSAARNADVVTVNSSATKQALAAATGVEAKVIPMGVDLSEFTATGDPRSSKENRPRHILFVGRLAEKKGVEHLIEAMPVVRRHMPDAILTIVGDGPERTALEDQARRLSLHGAVDFVGAVPHDKLPARYRASNVFVAPSVVASSGDTEGLGVVILEAAASGTPVVASRVGGITDVIRDGETGLLVEPGNDSEIASSVVRILQDGDLAASLAARARDVVIERYSWDGIADQFDEIYRSLEHVSS